MSTPSVIRWSNDRGNNVGHKYVDYMFNYSSWKNVDN